MKTILLGAAALVAFGLGLGSAGAADGSALLAQCEKNAAAEPATAENPGPPGGWVEFCTCLITNAGDNQTVIDEHLTIATAPPGPEREAAIEASSQATKDNAAKCLPAAPPAQ